MSTKKKFTKDNLANFPLIFGSWAEKDGTSWSFLVSRCASCSANLTELLSNFVNSKVGRRDTCPRCSADLRTCSNCEFYDSSSRWECREEVSERVANKESGNFCDFFKFKSGSETKVTLAKSKDDILSAAEALFRKK